MNILNKVVVAGIPLVPKPMVGYFSKRYIAGSTIDDAVDEVKRLNSMKMCSTIDVLGESIKNLEEAQGPVSQYLKVIDAIAGEKLDANISVKPTQLGLNLNYDECLDNYDKLVGSAAKNNIFVRIDMEDYTTTTKTLQLYTDLRKKYSNVGVVLQAYLRRTIYDIDDLSKKIDNLNFRICKGIYVEPHSVAWKDYTIIRRNYEYLLEHAFNKGAYIGIATHDEYLVWSALKTIHRLNIPKDRYEFQMLLGVLPELRKIIVDLGHKLRVYTPFGKQWYAYSTRRLRENPNVAGHIVKAMFTPAIR